MPAGISAHNLQSLRVLRGSIRNALWSAGRPARASSALSEYRLHYRSQRPLRELARRFEDPRLQSAFDGWAQSERLEYLYRYTGQAAIDPACGFIIADRLGPLLPSLMESDFAPMPSETTHIERLPSRIRYALAKRLHRSKTIHLPSAVSLRALSEANYWHFYHDVLSKLRLLEEFGIARDLPLVVSETLYQTPYFQQALARPGLAGRRFISQDSKTYIIAGEIVFGATMGYDKKNFD